MSNSSHESDKPSQTRKFRPKQVRQVTKEESSSDSEDNVYVYPVSSQSKTTNNMANVIIKGHNFKILIDTGASINVIDETTHAKMKNAQLRATKTKVFPYHGDSPVKLLGCFQAIIETKRKYAVATFYVAEGDSGCLLSSATAQDLSLIKFNLCAVQSTKPKTEKGESFPSPNNSPAAKNVNSIPEIAESSKLFEGIGKLKNYQLRLDIDETVKPVAQNQRRIPYHLRKQVKKELKNLQDLDIIEKVPDDVATPFVSPIVVVPKKNGSIRICVDMRCANKAIKRVRHNIPTVDDITMQLNGACYFSKLDLNQAYHQIELHPDSRYITTFTTHEGLFRYKRLSMGINAASEAFQYALQNALRGVKGVLNLVDDILVFGTTREEHDLALRICLDRLEECGLTLNKDKCDFLKTEIDLYGVNFSKEGVKPDPKKIEAFIKAPRPQNASEVRSILGMANYSSRYIPNYASITEPLRRLTRKNAIFVWRTEHTNAFNKLKQSLSKSPVMAYFDVQKDTQIVVDASPVGISAILAQAPKGSNEFCIVAYASRALTDVEQRYSQTEREALSIVWGIEYFHLFVYGAPFTPITDHKPLECIYGNPQSKPPARIERWLLRLQQYEFTVKYKPGAENPADYLSRHPVAQPTKENKAELYVNTLTEHSVPKSMSLAEIISATNEDKALQEVKQAITSGDWNSPAIQSFKAVKDELTINHSNGVILRGTRIIMPTPLQKRAVQIAHEGHQGIAKTKALIREKVWFPLIDKFVQDEIGKCLACQAIGKENPPEPLKMTKLPDGPWQRLNIDFFGPLPSGEYLLVVIDAYSRFPVVEITRSAATPAIIPILDKIFAMHGIPLTVKADGGPPFNGNDFKRYMETLGIDFPPPTPLWPQANGEVESFNRPLGKSIRAAEAEGRNWRQDIQRFLLAYRTTPHSSTNVPPAELLFNRTVNGKLPGLMLKKHLNRHNEAKKNDEVAKQKQKEYADKKRHARPSDIAVGDTVLVKQDKKNKLSTRFNTTPYIVISRQGSKVTAENDTHCITRNVSSFKRLPGREDIEESSTVEVERCDAEDERYIAEPFPVVVPEDAETEEDGNARRYPVRRRNRTQLFGPAIYPVA